jgi:hypothetical protein
MDEKAASENCDVSQSEALRALEVLSSLIFLTRCSADNGEQMRGFMKDAESCVSKLVRFMGRRRTPESSPEN